MAYKLAAFALGFAALASIQQADAQSVNAPYGHRALTVSPLVAAKGSVLLTYSPIYGSPSISIGVGAVSNPSTGVFCVTPKVKISLKAEPVVTVEWGSSLGNSLLAFWEQGAEDCNAGDIEVRTFDFSSGPAVAAQNVAFNVFVE
jgi:hypothetical protein